MFTEQSINIAMVGLSLRIQRAMREVLASALPAGWIGHWVSIADIPLDSIVINMDFAQAPSVQKILLHRPVPVLQLDTAGQSGTDWAQDRALMDPMDEVGLRHWLQARLGAAGRWVDAAWPTAGAV